jgi:hypothetical protein
MIGTPTEQIGFQAAEEYASRMSSPRPQSGYHVSHSNLSDTHVESPLRKESNAEAADKKEFERTLSRSLHAPSDVSLSESEYEGEDTIHVDSRARRISQIYGATGHLESVEDLEPNAEDDEEYGAPILASDEVAKEPFGWDLQPAVSHRRGSHQDDSFYHLRTGSASSLTNSRPSSRPGSIHGNIPGLRMTESTPLEDLEEYEPLFPEDEKSGTAMKKPLTAAERLKRPELKVRLHYSVILIVANMYFRTGSSPVKMYGKIPRIVCNTQLRSRRLNCRRRLKMAPSLRRTRSKPGLGNKKSLLRKNRIAPKAF